MDKSELEVLLKDFDEELVKAFPHSDPMRVLVVGGACLLFEGVITRQTTDVDVIIFDMMGSEESTLIFHSPLADKLRRLIKRVGRRHGVQRTDMFFNDDCSPFLLELSDNVLPPMRLYKAYQRLHLYVPNDLNYILACKLIAARPEKDLEDIAILCERLNVKVRKQAQAIVNTYFPSQDQQEFHQLPQTLQALFEG